MKCPAEVYQPSPRSYQGLPDLDYPLHDKTIVVTRICMGRKKINFSQVFAGQAVGIKEVHDDIWLVSFMDYDLDTSIWRPEYSNRSKSLRPKVVTYVAGTFCYPCVRAGPRSFGCGGWI